MNRKEVLVAVILLFIGVMSFLLDSRVSELFRDFQNPLVSSVLSILEPVWFYVILAILAVILLIRQNKRKWFTPFFLTIGANFIVVFIIKLVLMRPRPLGLVEYMPFTNIIDFSFPSSHTAFMFAILPLLNQELKRYNYIWISLAILVAISRLYFNAHYLSDVLFGALLGYAIGYGFLKFGNNKKIKKKK